MTARNCPRAIPARDCVSYPPVLHQVKPCAKLEYTQGRRRQSVAKLLSKNEARRTTSLLIWIKQPYWKLGVPSRAMAQDYQLPPVQLSRENAEVERLRIRSERMELVARAFETLAGPVNSSSKPTRFCPENGPLSSPCCMGAPSGHCVGAPIDTSDVVCIKSSLGRSRFSAKLSAGMIRRPTIAMSGFVSAISRNGCLFIAR